MADNRDEQTRIKEAKVATPTKEQLEAEEKKFADTTATGVQGFLARFTNSEKRALEAAEDKS